MVLKFNVRTLNLITSLSEFIKLERYVSSCQPRSDSPIAQAGQAPRPCVAVHAVLFMLMREHAHHTSEHYDPQ